MAVSTKYDEKFASIDETSVAVSRCRSLSLNFPIAAVLSWSLISVLNWTETSIILVWRDILSLFHGCVILVKALVSILDYKGIHHTNRGRCSELNACHCSKICFTLVSAISTALSRDL